MELPFIAELPDPCSFSLTGISIEHSWYSVEKDINDKLYIGIDASPSMLYTAITITPQNYTGYSLKTEIYKPNKPHSCKAYQE